MVRLRSPAPGAVLSRARRGRGRPGRGGRLIARRSPPRSRRAGDGSCSPRASTRAGGRRARATTSASPRWPPASPTAGPVPADCRDVEFSFAPQRAVEVGYLLSGGACLLLLAFLVFGERAPAAVRGRALRARPVPAGLRPRPLAVAAALALPLAAAVAFVFALRAGAVAFPLLTLLFWRGRIPRLAARSRRRPAGRGRPRGVCAVPAGRPRRAQLELRHRAARRALDRGRRHRAACDQPFEAARRQTRQGHPLGSPCA